MANITKNIVTTHHQRIIITERQNEICANQIEVTLNHTATQCFVGIGYASAYLNI